MPEHTQQELIKQAVDIADCSSDRDWYFVEACRIVGAILTCPCCHGIVIGTKRANLTQCWNTPITCQKCGAILQAVVGEAVCEIASKYLQELGKVKPAVP